MAVQSTRDGRGSEKRETDGTCAAGVLGSPGNTEGEIVPPHEAAKSGREPERERGGDALAAAGCVEEARLWQRLMEMARHGATAAGGVNRQALSAEDIEARRLMLRWGGTLGLEASTDEIGNLYLRRPGTDDAAAPVMTGSHLDSQPMGGKFDGAYGVLAGLEALQAMNQAGIRTRRPVELVAWTNEEGSRFQPGTMGSCVFTRRMALAELLPAVDRDGVSVAQALSAFLDATPELPRRQSGFPVAAFVEAHIEQGPILERAGKPIGAVGGVQGLRWFRVEVTGEAAHAGTTPLRLRKDALKAASAMVVAMDEALADERDILRFTVGRFEVHPGAPSTVPARVLFTIDLRHPEQTVIDRMTAKIEAACKAHARGCDVALQRTEDVSPTVFDPALVETIGDWSDRLGLARETMVSGAGHDAVHMADVCPSGMIFVPCEDGVSHNEGENATPGDLAAGARVLTATLVDLAQR